MAFHIDDDFLHLLKADQNYFDYVIAWPSSFMNTSLDKHWEGEKHLNVDPQEMYIVWI